MIEKIVERFCDAPTQYRHLLQTEKLLEKRALDGKKRLIQYVVRPDLCYRFYNECPIYIYAVSSIHEHIYLLAYRHNDVHDDDRHLDGPILRHPPHTCKLSGYSAYTSVLKNLFSREADTDPHLRGSIVRQFEPDACYRRHLGS